ncbi:MAG: hypothetical protein RL385_3798 [Pseudomonadota bacterium]|jgi:hypothetical protein
MTAWRDSGEAGCGPQVPGPKVLYLGIGGVLQPSSSTYHWVHGRDPFEDGHRRYESAPLLAQLLQGWPEVRIVLTSTRPWKHGLAAVLAELGTALASRVIGYTFDDLTKRAKVGERFPRCLSEMDYWRLGKAQIVEKHMRWLRPTAWIAVDDEGYGWTDQDLACQVVVTPGVDGLLNVEARAKLHGLLEHQFGPPEQQATPSADEKTQLNARLFDPALARRFALTAAAQAFAYVRPRPTVLLLGLERTLFTFVEGVLEPRPHAFSFLTSCGDLFERLVVMPGDIDQFHHIARELVQRGAVPCWFAHLDCVAWNGRVKDLERTGAATLAEALAVDANRAFMLPTQEAQWLDVAAFDGSPGDFELLSVYERLKAALADERRDKAL